VVRRRPKSGRRISEDCQTCRRGRSVIKPTPIEVSNHERLAEDNHFSTPVPAAPADGLLRGRVCQSPAGQVVVLTASMTASANLRASVAGAPILTAASVGATLTRRGQAGYNLLRVLDSQHYPVVLAVG
jgi:hypothetical protein